jgi:hypothetical protein
MMFPEVILMKASQMDRMFKTPPVIKLRASITLRFSPWWADRRRMTFDISLKGFLIKLSVKSAGIRLRIFGSFPAGLQ